MNKYLLYVRCYLNCSQIYAFILTFFRKPDPPKVLHPPAVTPPCDKWSAPTTHVHTVVDEVAAVGRGWRVVTAVNERARHGVPQEEVTRREYGTLVRFYWDAGRSFDVDAQWKLGFLDALCHWYRVVDVAFVDVVTIERVLCKQIMFRPSPYVNSAFCPFGVGKSSTSLFGWG